MSSLISSRPFLVETIVENLSARVDEVADPLSETGKKKKLFLEGVCIQGEIRNHNGRIYPVSEIRRAVNQITRLRDEGKSILGELDHPEELIIRAKYASHCIEKMWMEGNNGMGRLRIFEDTPDGKMIKTLISESVVLGVSSRGSGDVDDRGYVNDFDIITIDVVARASAHDAYPKPIYEAKYSKYGREITEIAHELQYSDKYQRDFTTLCLEWLRSK